jgi:ATP-dependent RNA helicase DeaD
MMNVSPSALGIAEDTISVVSAETDDQQLPLISASDESGKTTEETEQHPLHRFSEYTLRPELQATLARKGFEHPMPVQVSVLEDPSLTEGDLIVQARTGSGKTLAFALPLLNEMAPSLREPHVLVLSPTRELALQTAREFAWAASGLNLRVASLVGGMDMERQFRSLSEGVAIVVGTPGRVMDHIRRGSFRGGSVEVLVLDEGDHMLDLGFRNELEGIMQALPNRKRTWLYSATMPEEVVTLARRYLDAPRKISLVSDITCHEDIVQAAYLVPGRRRFDGLVNVLLLERPERALIFCATRAETQDIADRLSDEGFRAGSIHGDMTQRERNSALAALKGGRIEILVATDVAARGLDIQGVSHVVQFGLPGCIESFVHRSGRTGRAGRSGKNLVLVTAREARVFKGMLSSTHLRLEWLPAPDRSELEGLTRTRLVEDLAEATSDAEDHLPWADEILDRPDARSLVAAMLGRLSSVRGGGYSIKTDLEQELAREQNRRDIPRRDGRSAGPRGGRTGEPHRFDSAEGVMVRFRGGRQNGVEVGRMLGSLCRALGIRGDDVGNIRLRDDHAQVELSSRGAAALRDRGEQLEREGLILDGEARAIPAGASRSGGYRGGDARGAARRPEYRREDSARGGSGTRFRGESGGGDDGYGRRPRR